MMKSNYDIAKKLCSNLRKYLINVKAQTPIDRETNLPVPLPHL